MLVGYLIHKLIGGQFIAFCTLKTSGLLFLGTKRGCTLLLALLSSWEGEGMLGDVDWRFN